MKNPKSRVILGLVIAAVLLLVLYSQHGISQPHPLPESRSFNSHYREVDLTLGLGQSATIPLPVVNRAIRISVVMSSDQDGEIDLEDVSTLYSVNPGFEGLVRLLGYTGNNLFGLSSGPAQSLIITAAEDKSGPVRVTMWY